MEVDHGEGKAARIPVGWLKAENGTALCHTACIAYQLFKCRYLLS
jgi:hypothetical protein